MTAETFLLQAEIVGGSPVVLQNHRFTLDNGSNILVLPNHNASHRVRRSPSPRQRHAKELADI